VYTYHEKKKDAQASGYGTNSQRVGKDSIKNFDCCSLTLQPCVNPVVTPDGYLYDKEAILVYIITRKKEYYRKLKEYEKQKRKEQAELAAAEERSKLNSLMKTEKNIVSAPIKAFKSDPLNAENPSVSNMTEGRDKHLPSFWIPSKTPEAKDKTLKKPDKTVYCPASGKPLKAKDLIDVKFTPVKDPDDKKASIVKQNRYTCSVTYDTLSNSVPCAVIRTTGDVVTMKCVERIINKDWTHPLTGEKLKEQDIIPLQREGTGYSTTNLNLAGKHEACLK
jgi:nitric oxide synthase-interacting protein